MKTWNSTEAYSAQNHFDRSPSPLARIRASGKFLWTGGEKLHVRSVTCGTFHPDPSGISYPGPEKVDRDFIQMAANGINGVRMYDVPPRWLPDVAGKQGLRVMVGLQVERLSSFLDREAGLHPYGACLAERGQGLEPEGSIGWRNSETSSACWTTWRGRRRSWIPALTVFW
jgi:hypothetical protein